MPNVSDHGTLFAFTTAKDAAGSPDDWQIRHSNGHSRTIKQLIPGTSYLFTAAYKGLDDADLVWCPPVTKMVV